MVVTEQELAPPPGVTVVRVPKARLALAHISAAFYDHPSRQSFVGITGTNGKTSTTYILEAILTAAGGRVGVVGTVNYRVGDSTWPAPVTTPESLDLLSGSSGKCDPKRHPRLPGGSVPCPGFKPGGWRRLRRRSLHQPLSRPPGLPSGSGRIFCRQIPALFGNPAHGCPSQKGLAVLNLDDPLGGMSLKDAIRGPALTYGLHPESQVRPLSHRFRQDGLEARRPPRRVKWRSPPAWWGRLTWPISWRPRLRPWAWGLTLAPAARASPRSPACPAGWSVWTPAGSRGVRGLRPHARRPSPRPWRGLQTLNFSRLITVFGCGGDRDRAKRPLMGRATAAGRTWSSSPATIRAPKTPGHHRGDRARALRLGGLPRLDAAAAQRGEAGYLVVPDRRDAIRLAVALARPGEAVLVAGKGHENYQIWGAERRYFDDREEVVQALADTTAGCECHFYHPRKL